MKLKQLFANVCALFLFTVFFSATACFGGGNSICILEAEKGIIEPAYDPDVSEICRAASKSENVTSGGKYVGKLTSGSKITWSFNSETQGNCEFLLVLANADSSAEGFTAESGKTFSFNVNGSGVVFASVNIRQGSTYSDDWQTLSMGVLPVKRGVNHAEFTLLDESHELNVDYLAVKRVGTNIQEHNHSWEISSSPATCEAQGATYKSCTDCSLTFQSEQIEALGHDYDAYHYDDETMKMVAKCLRCENHIIANTPSSKYFGEVFADESQFETREERLVYEAEWAYVNVSAGLSNAKATNHVEVDNGNMNSPSGGKCVGNISRVGNYIRFTLESQQTCQADLVFKMSNVLYRSDGIGELDPMSQYVYCTVNGAQVDISFVSFPGYGEHKYYEWRYVVIKNVELTAGENTVEVGPKQNNSTITMPNTDALFVYTQEPCVKAVKYYQLNEVSVGAYEGAYANTVAFESQAEDEFTFCAGKEAKTADYVLRISAQGTVLDLAQRLQLSVNGQSVNVENLALSAGDNTLILRNVPVRLMKNVVKVEFAEGVALTKVSAYSDEELVSAIVAEIDESYDYTQNENGKTPSFIFEAEKADLGASVSSRDGVALIEYNIYENSGKLASGNSIIGNFASQGNTLSWRFTASKAGEADLAVMLASANFLDSLGGNAATENVEALIRLTVNGVAVDLSGIDLPVDGLGNYYFWQAVVLKNVSLKEGENEVKIEVLSGVSPNIDVLYVFSEEIEFTAI